MIRSYIGLGSNLGDSLQILREAVQQLSQLGALKVSRLYQSPPMGPQDQPHYFNAVVCLETMLAPLDLLDQLQAIEQQAGRVRLRHWGERTLDLDLLLYAAQKIDHPRLQVPHVGILERDFVLLPLLDLAPDLCIESHKLRELDIVKNSALQAMVDQHWAVV